MFYQHFANLEACLAAASERITHEIRQTVAVHRSEMYEKTSPTSEDLDKAFREMFEFASKQRPVAGGKVGLAPHTMKNYLVALKTTLKWGVKQKFLPSLPSFPRIKVPKKKPQPISQEDFDKLLAEAPDPLWRAYLLCGWSGGLRLSEARALRRSASSKWPWVDFENNRIVLPAEFVKSAEDQWIPMHSTLRKALEEIPGSEEEFFPFVSQQTNRPLTRSAITNRVINLAKKAKVKLSMHRLRKGFGCRVAKQLGKGQAPVLHRLMRHSSMQITMDYYASVDDALQDLIEDLE